MPLFNKAPYVQRAIKSVISQTYNDFELIVVDDGSSDDSVSIAKESLIQSPVVSKLIQQKNAGVSMARNNGIAESQGDYICFLDADDWWDTTFLERVDWLIKEFPDAGGYGTNYYYVKNGHQRVCITTAETGYINYCRVYAEKLQMPLTSSSACIPRAVLNKIGGFKPHLKLGEDFDLWIRIALQSKIAFLNEPLSFYFQDSDPKWKLVGRLHDPSVHMLWNIDYLYEEERCNPDYKRLIDRLRVYSLYPYFLSREYHDAASNELAKVDWDKQSKRVQSLYHLPLFWLRCRQLLLKYGSSIKQSLIKHL